MHESQAIGAPGDVPVSDAEKRRALPWSVAAGVLASSVFTAWTVVGSVFLLYLRELDISKAQIGFLLSLFPFCQLIAPLVAPALARLGAKRVCVGAYVGRSLAIAALLLLPLVMAAGGRAWAVAAVTVVLLVYAVLRAVAETAWYPWGQDYTPEDVRGKYGALNSVCAGAASLLALAVAGYVIAHGQGLGRFMLLQGAGCAAGLCGAVLFLKVPGGRPTPASGMH